ncbi:MAG: putative Histidine kinase [Nitrospira sp.]
MSVTLEKKIATGLGGALILLIGLSIVSYRSATALVDREARVTHAHQVRQAIEHLKLLVAYEAAPDKVDLVAGRATDGGPVREAGRDLRAMAESLARLTQDDPGQREQVSALRRLIDADRPQFAQSDGSIGSQESGVTYARETRLQAGKTEDTFDRIVRTLETLGKQEEMNLTAWSKQADRAASFTMALVIGGSLLTLLLAGGGGALIFCDLAKRRRAEDAVRVKQAYQDLILRSLPVAMYSAKSSGDFGALWVSENIEELAGFSARDFLNDSSLWATRLHPLDKEGALGKFATLPQDNTLSMEYRWRTRDGEYRWFRDEAVLIRRKDGALQEIVGLWTDITMQQKAEELIRRQADIINQVEETVIIIDLNGYVMSWNHGAEKLLGYSVDEAIGRHISFVYPAEDRAYLDREVLAPVKAKGTHHVEVRRLTKDGRIRFAQLSLTLQKDGSGAPIGIIGYSMDITERKRAEEALVDSRNQLEALAVRLQSVREEERTRIALEVHDVLGQALTVLKMDLCWIGKRLGDATTQARFESLHARVNSALGLIDSTLQSVREIATELRPGVLDQLGLAAAVEWQARTFQERTGIACDTLIRPHRILLSAEQSTALFRIFQEVLTNVARHAQATTVRIRLEESDDHVSLQVTDDGRGIPEGALTGPHAFGMLGMQLRAQQQGGKLTILGKPGAGTTVTVRIPVHRSGDD